jgi:hypothetical protein
LLNTLIWRFLNHTTEAVDIESLKVEGYIMRGRKYKRKKTPNIATFQTHESVCSTVKEEYYD